MSKICKQDNYKVRIEKLFLHNTGYVTFHVFFSSFVNSLGFGFSRAGVQGPASVRPRSRLSGPRTKPDQIRKFWTRSTRRSIDLRYERFACKTTASLHSTYGMDHILLAGGTNTVRHSTGVRF